MATGHNETHAVKVVEHALGLGINFIDTARAYGTEPAVGKAIKGRRETVVISTKVSPGRGDAHLSADQLVDSLEKSLTRLGTDYVDVLHLHGVSAAQYPYCVEVLVPEMQRLRDAGKIRFLGVTEAFSRDFKHEMFETTLADDHFDVVMEGFNLLNPSARVRVFPQTLEKDVGTLIMFAVP
jgi:aryl-alcohol dehydrogenase-like predicted oxidoreductase